jgi:cob(I)alamin adenosyltransferase
LASAAVGCSGLEAEAMLAGVPVRLPKHSPVFQLYGALEEAEARLGLARAQAGDGGDVGGALLLAQRLARAALHVVATGDTGVAGPLLREAEAAVHRLARGVEGGWSMAGCSVPEAEAAVAAAKLREADRLVSALAEQGLLPRPVAEAADRLLAAAAQLVYWARLRLCRGSVSRSSRELVLGAAGATR